jgi:3-hydroxybenzoate 6-monooxygenase
VTAPHVIVIGGGIGGLAAALALARVGVPVRVYERAAEFGEVGAGLQLAPNCTRILAEHGLLDDAKRLGVLPRAMVMKDATDGSELTRLDLVDLEKRYGFPYLVMHRSDLHTLLLDAARQHGVELLTGRTCTEYENVRGGARVTFADGSTDEAAVVIAADGLHSAAREALVGDDTVSSSYVAYRGAVPFEQVAANDVHEHDVVVYVGPGRHFVQYPLRGGEMFNQVAVFRSPKADAGAEDWGTPDELDAAFEGSCAQVQKGLPLMWRDRWWRMFDRDPIDSWVFGRVVLLGDAAHPPLQYMAQGAIMAVEDGWVLAQHALRATRDPLVGSGPELDWDAVLAAYDAVRPAHCARVVETARAWGDLWHLDGPAREQRNAYLRHRDAYDYSFIDWIYGPTALTPDDEAPAFEPIPLDSVVVPETVSP